MGWALYGVQGGLRHLWDVEDARDENSHGSAVDHWLGTVAQRCCTTVNGTPLEVDLFDPRLHPLLACHRHIGKHGWVGSRWRCVACSILGTQQEDRHRFARDRTLRTVDPGTDTTTGGHTFFIELFDP